MKTCMNKKNHCLETMMNKGLQDIKKQTRENKSIGFFEFMG